MRQVGRAGHCGDGRARIIPSPLRSSQDSGLWYRAHSGAAHAGTVHAYACSAGPPDPQRGNPPSSQGP